MEERGEGKGTERRLRSKHLTLSRPSQLLLCSRELQEPLHLSQPRRVMTPLSPSSLRIVALLLCPRHRPNPRRPRGRSTRPLASVNVSPASASPRPLRPSRPPLPPGRAPGSNRSLTRPSGGGGPTVRHELRPSFGERLHPLHSPSGNSGVLDQSEPHAFVQRPMRQAEGSSLRLSASNCSL